MTDLSKIPPPDSIEQLSFEEIRDDMLGTLESLVSTELSSPIVQLVEAFAYREMYLRARINDAQKAAFLPTAWGTNLDNIGARDGVERRVLDPGDPDAVPPVPPTLEDPEDYRKRILEASRAIGAGVRETYEGAARAAHPAIVDVFARRTGPAAADIHFLAPDADPDEVRVSIEGALEPVRVLTDELRVVASTRMLVPANVTVYVGSGPDMHVVLERAQASAERWSALVERINRPIYGSELSAAATVPGVVRVEHDLGNYDASPMVAYRIQPSVTAQEATWRT